VVDELVEREVILQGVALAHLVERVVERPFSHFERDGRVERDTAGEIERLLV